MNRRFLRLLFPVFGLLVLTGCPDGPDPEPNPPTPTPNPYEASNTWIYNQMKTHYLYTDYLQSLTPDYTLSNEDFFESLLSTSPSDNDGKHPNRYGSSYFYSYLESTATSKHIGSNVTSYGIEYAGYRVSSTSSRVLLRVLYVASGSVAETAGIKRGMWISQIGGADLTTSNYTAVESGGAVSVTAGMMYYNTSNPSSPYLDWSSGYPKTFSLGTASRITNSPVFLSKVIGTTGYLIYNEFNTGPGGFSDKTFDNELKAAFREFKNRSVRNLVVDLRYNPGGYVDCCTLLGSLIAPRTVLGQTFFTSQYNAARQAALNPQPDKLLPVGQVSDCNLDLQRVYVLTGRNTASASELLINSLRPYMDVVVLGSKTEGKNVGSYLLQSSEYQLDLHPITFKTFNSRGQADYKEGFTPQAEWDEQGDVSVSLIELGDPTETLLKMALDRIGGLALSAPSAAGTTKTSAAGMACFASSVEKRAVRGMLIPTPGE